MSVSRRKFLEKGLAAAAAASAAAVSGADAAMADTPSTPASDAAKPSDSAALFDPKFTSPAGHALATDAIHAGEETGFSVTPIYQGKNYKGRYQRPSFNPTIWALEAKLKALEGGTETATAPCGMAIIAQTYLALAKSGDRIVAHRCNYDGVMDLLRDRLPRFGIEVDLIDMNDPQRLRDALKKKKTRFVHFEPYVNPTMEVLPALELIQIAAEHGAKSVVDNTWLTPVLFQPLRHGADLVIHSATKYIGGHGSAMGGVVCGRDSNLVKEIRRASIPFGALLRPFDAFLLDQGFKTLPLRVERHTASATIIAKWLAEHPKVARVRYGGLKSWADQQHSPAYTRGYAGMIGIEWKDAKT
ncbi:MAG: PLP-dependent transferase, partial [Planctomycetia bacterium]|nr:PLP-dependent transferase [Planctomycetia bacterium]